MPFSAFAVCCSCERGPAVTVKTQIDTNGPDDDQQDGFETHKTVESIPAVREGVQSPQCPAPLPATDIQGLDNYSIMPLRRKRTRTISNVLRTNSKEQTLNPNELQKMLTAQLGEAIDKAPDAMPELRRLSTRSRMDSQADVGEKPCTGSVVASKQEDSENSTRASSSLASPASGPEGPVMTENVPDADVAFGRLNSTGSTGSSLRRQKTFIRRNSQRFFAHKKQTVIVLDWDDTIFPTTYVQEDSGLKVCNPLNYQDQLNREELKSIEDKLMKCDAAAECVLSSAIELGHVIIMTLARRPWVQMACQHFYPRVFNLIRTGQVSIVYALDSVGAVSMQPEELENDDEIAGRYWSLVKGCAIAREVEQFYSQYEGQTWKNVISVGDTCFERYGALAAVNHYASTRFLGTANSSSALGPQNLTTATDEGMGKAQALEGVFEGHFYRVRPKVLQMLEDPTVEELASELVLLERWLPVMVAIDNSCDLGLKDLSQESISEVDQTLEDLGGICGGSFQLSGLLEEPMTSWESNKTSSTFASPRSASVSPKKRSQRKSSVGRRGLW